MKLMMKINNNKLLDNMHKLYCLELNKWIKEKLFSDLVSEKIRIKKDY